MRIRPTTADSVDERTKRVLEAQTKKWGAPLVNHLVYARVPAIFGAVRGMWGGLGAAGLIEEGLQAIVNRRVAQINGCEF